MFSPKNGILLGNSSATHLTTQISIGLHVGTSSPMYTHYTLTCNICNARNILLVGQLIDNNSSLQLVSAGNCRDNQ